MEMATTARSRPSAAPLRRRWRLRAQPTLLLAATIAPPLLLAAPSVSARTAAGEPSSDRRPRRQRRQQQEQEQEKYEPICPTLSRPPHEDKYRTARWMVHSLDWGVLTTISTRNVEGLGDGGDPAAAAAAAPPVPFGNVYSFVDGPCSNSTGIPYLYASMLDQSMQDVLSNPVVSLTLSEASLSGTTPAECAVTAGGWGDPEMPPCGRLVATGRFVRLDADGSADGGSDKEEMEFVRRAMLERHPSVKYWPKDHEPFAAKIVLNDLWFLDWFGGATVLDLDEYYKVDLFAEAGLVEDIKSE